METHGIIFQRSKSTQDLNPLAWAVISEVVSLWQDLVRPVKKSLKLWARGLTLGALLVVLTTAILPIWLNRAEAAKRLAELKKSQITFADLLRVEANKPVAITDSTYFTVEIPKVGAYSKVIANVNPADSQIYTEALKEGIAHAAGTYLPGMGGTVTLFSHSTDLAANVAYYNAVFYRLDELVPGDEVTVWFLGERRVYRVEEVKVTPPSDVSIFERQNDGEKLILMTCTPRGTTKNRLVVTAKPLTG